MQLWRAPVLFLCLVCSALAQDDLSGNHRLRGRPFWGGDELPVELLLERGPAGTYRVTHTYADPAGQRVVLSGEGQQDGDAVSARLGRVQGLGGRLGAMLAEAGPAAPRAFQGRWRFAPDGAVTGALRWESDAGPPRSRPWSRPERPTTLSPRPRRPARSRARICTRSSTRRTAAR